MAACRGWPGCAQRLSGVDPDLTGLGKAIGGGLPAAAYGGKAEIMNRIAPDGPVYQAGTLSGNPLAVAAGQKMLELLSRPGTYEKLEAASKHLTDGLSALLAEASIPHATNRVGSMFTTFFTEGPAR